MDLDLSFLPLEMIGQVLQGLIFVGTAYLMLLSLSLVVWTWNDISARSRDIFARLLAPLMVLVFNLPGLLLYFVLRPHETLSESYERELEAEALLQDMQQRNVCPECGYSVHADFVICPICETEIRYTCLNCGRLLQPSWRACPYCGRAVADEDLQDLRMVATARNEPLV